MKLVGKTLSSPLLDLPGYPLTPTRSPRLIALCTCPKASSSSPEVLQYCKDALQDGAVKCAGV